MGPAFEEEYNLWIAPIQSNEKNTASELILQSKRVKSMLLKTPGPAYTRFMSPDRSVSSVPAFVRPYCGRTTHGASCDELYAGPSPVLVISNFELIFPLLHAIAANAQPTWMNASWTSKYAASNSSTKS